MSNQPVHNVLISGAGIAGPALAHQLAASGVQVTVVERSAGIRTAGQLVDLRGNSQEAVRRMGLFDRIMDARLPQNGIAYINGRGRVFARWGIDMFGGHGPVSDLEIFRGDISEILHEAVRDRVDFRFNDKITSVDEHTDHISVSFEHGRTERYDLVVAADGLHSATRRLIWGPEDPYVHQVGGHTAYFTMPAPEPLDGWTLAHVLSERRMTMIRPDHDPALAHAIMTFLDQPGSVVPDRHDPHARREMLIKRFTGADWHVPAMVAALESADDLYFDSVAQVKMPELSRGRVVLLGDAGYCPSPSSGQGTALALVGAYILAGELTTGTDLASALRSYEALMAPQIAAGQQLPPGSTSWSMPKTRYGVKLAELATVIAGHRPVSSMMAKAMAVEDKIDLPSYPAVTEPQRR
ncbi:FAD-dependent monooxygenase [Microlunatus elymi]|nr:FAD-dependent monooxygenase [Microlunatus elymi]